MATRRTLSFPVSDDEKALAKYARLCRTLPAGEMWRRLAVVCAREMQKKAAVEGVTLTRAAAAIVRATADDAEALEITLEAYLLASDAAAES